MKEEKPSDKKPSGNKPILLIWMIIISLGFVVAYQYVSKFGRGSDRVPMKFGLLKNDFSYINSHGKKGRLGDLRGKVWIINQIFTHCPTVCSPMTKKLANLQKKLKDLGEDFVLVSITFDPENDKPEVLKKYAEDHEVDFSNWLWITGEERESVEKYLKDSLMFGSVRRKLGESSHGTFDHTNYVALIDGRFEYRDYYDDKRILNGDLERDVRKLIKEIREN